MIEKAVEKISDLSKLAISGDLNQRKMLHRILKNAALLQPTARLELADRERVATIRSVLPNVGNPSMLQGSVETLEQSREKSKAKVLDLTVAQIIQVRNDNLASERNVHWLKETAFDWVGVKSRNTDLGQAAAILNCSEDCLIKTEISTIHCRQGALVFVDNHEKYQTICTLDSNRLHDVTVTMPSGPSLKLPAGCALVLRKQVLAGAHPSPANLMTYRSWSERKTAGDIDIYGADFSLAQAMYFIEPLRQMIQSDDPKLRAKARAILKNATILAQIDPGISYQP